MSRQHAAPILLGTDGERGAPLRELSVRTGESKLGELKAVQQLVHDHPECLPIAEIDSLFANPVPICMELNTPAGPVDNLLVTSTGLPVLVECKLWRNPEARREVVGQILDYAKELSRWTSSNLQWEVSRRLGRPGNVLLELVRAAGHEIDEVDFNDALTRNLRRGRLLLLIVGDGIREGVEAITEYLQAHAGLHFTLGLVEMPIYETPSGQRLVVPRVLARTHNLVRTVVAAPEGYVVQGEDDGSLTDDGEGRSPLSPEEAEKRNKDNELRRTEYLEFWGEFLGSLALDDPEQPVPRASRGANLYFMLPVPQGNSWISVYRSKRNVGVFLSATRHSLGERAALLLARDEEALREELGPETRIHFSDTEYLIAASRPLSNFFASPERDEAFAWLRERTNDFVNALRPRIKAAVAELDE